MLGFVTIPDAGGADRLLAETAALLEREGLRLAGAVQQNLDRGEGQDCDMDLRILGDGAVIRISQNLGTCAEGCRLDTGALAQAVARAEAALARGADLVIVNKFGRVEAEGGGFRDLIAQALDSGIPVLVAVPPKFQGAFTEFAGDLSQAVEPGAALDWCRGAVRPRAA